jgi:ribulose bisphosphate carboxylase small subunit
MARRDRQQEADGARGTSRQPAGSSWSPENPGLDALIEAAPIVECRPIPWGSNGTFLLTLDGGDEGLSHAIYKPRRGEAPLWDFPRGSLHRRELAAFLISEGAGWALIPPTVVRDGPFGAGSVQLFIEHDPEACFAPPVERDREAAEQIALLDCVLNNADRKAEHCIQDLHGRTWAIDHGLTFHVEAKLRTVIWDFAGDPIPEALAADLAELRQCLASRSQLYCRLTQLVSEAEVSALELRLSRLLRQRRHPDPGVGRRRVPYGGWWP